MNADLRLRSRRFWSFLHQGLQPVPHPLTAAKQPQAPLELRAALSAITRHLDDYV
jgi:hypothetical protein